MRFERPRLRRRLTHLAVLEFLYIAIVPVALLNRSISTPKFCSIVVKRLFNGVCAPVRCMAFRCWPCLKPPPARMLHENRSVRDFIDADYSFVNKGLARLYGVPFQGDKAEEFQRVIFPSNVNRGGLLGHASILTLTANGVETSPIERGVWVLADLLGTPPPPPPKKVPALTPDLNGAATIRDMLEKHRSDSACMECHRRMDPLGFALEAYDPIGRLRTKYSAKQAVSTHGNYLGRDFTDVAELKQILSSDIRPFARNLIIRIAEYAKGRKLVATDYATVESIVDQSVKNDFKFKDIVLSIASSDLMTHR